MIKKFFKPVGFDCKYFEAEVVDVKKTPSDNFLIFTKGVKSMHLADDKETVFTNVVTAESMRFLVPRRREGVVRALDGLVRENTYVFKLIKERHSEKFCVSGIFVRG